MSRVQLALNVDDVDAAVEFYGTLFQAEPHKRRPGYANFALTDPPLKLVLIENKGAGGGLNHLGVEVETPAEVSTTNERLNGVGLPTAEDNGTCCFATQDKVWVSDPTGTSWEIYTVTDDNPVIEPTAETSAAPCCV